MGLRLITDATVEIVTLPEIKLHLGLSTESTIEDTLLNSFIKASRRAAERITHQAFTQQTWKLTLDTFPAVIRPPRPPISSSAGDVTITYLDPTSGNSTTLGATAYTVDAETKPARIYPSYNNSWPRHRAVRAAITVQYLAGATDATAVDEEVRDWVKLRVGSFYENRESNSPSDLSAAPFMDGMLDDHVLIEVFP